MGRKALLAVICWLTLNEALSEAEKIVNSSVADSRSEESAPRLYHSVPLGVYAGAAPYGSYSFHAPVVSAPIKDSVIQSTNSYLKSLKDSYGQFVQQPQAAAYKAAFPQQYVQLQELPAHLSQPLVAAAPSFQYKQTAPQYFFGSQQFRIPSIHQAATPTPLTRFGSYSQPVVYAENIRSFAPSHGFHGQVQRFTMPQQQQGNARANTANAATFQRLQVTPQTQVAASENNRDTKQLASNNQHGQIQAAPAQTSVTAIVNGKKTVITLDTKPPLPLLDLNLLEPLTFDTPFVPQVQHFLPRINTATYHKLPHFIVNDAKKKEILVQKTTSYDGDVILGTPKKSFKKKQKPRVQNAPVKPQVKPVVTVKTISMGTPEISYEINEPGFKEVYNERAVSYNKETNSEPVSYSYDEKTNKKPVTYSFTRSSKEPLQVKHVEYESDPENPKQLVYTFSPEEQEEEQNEEIRRPPPQETEDPEETSAEADDEAPPSQPQRVEHHSHHPESPKHSQHSDHHNESPIYHHSHEVHHKEPQRHHKEPQGNHKESQKYHPHSDDNRSHHESPRHSTHHSHHDKPSSHSHHDGFHGAPRHSQHHGDHHSHHEGPPRDTHHHESPRQSHHEHHDSPRQSHHEHHDSPRQSHHEHHDSPRQSHHKEHHESPRQSHHGDHHDSPRLSHHGNHYDAPRQSHQEEHHESPRQSHHLRPEHREVVYHHSPNEEEHHHSPQSYSQPLIVPEPNNALQPIVREYEEDIRLLPPHQNAPIKVDPNQHVQLGPSADREDAHPAPAPQKALHHEHESESDESDDDGPAPHYLEKSKRIIIKEKEETPEEMHSHTEQLMAQMLEQQENNEEDFEKAYKESAHGFPAYEQSSEDVVKDIYNPEAYGTARYQNEYEVDHTPFQQYQQEGDDLPNNSRSNYKDSRDKMKEDYFLDFSVNKPVSFRDRHKEKENYFKTYEKHRPEKLFLHEDKDKKEKQKEQYVVAAPSYVYPASTTKPKQIQYFAQYKAAPKRYEYDYSKGAPRDSSAFASHSFSKHRTQFVEPQFQYGFEPIAVPLVLDSELAAMASNNSPETEKPGIRKKIYKENWYIKKTSTTAGKPS